MIVLPEQTAVKSVQVVSRVDVSGGLVSTAEPRTLGLSYRRFRVATGIRIQTPEVNMLKRRSPRVWLVVGLMAAGAGAALAGADRSSSSMTTAATAFLASLTPEQKGKAVFPFASDERV